MYWQSKEDFAKSVRVEWVRRVVPGAGNGAGAEMDARVGNGAASRPRSEAYEERVVAPIGEWRQRNGRHFLTYTDPSDASHSSESPESARRARLNSMEPSAPSPLGSMDSKDSRDSPGDVRSPSGNRTTLKLESNRFTLIRFGDVQWCHEFAAGDRKTSTIQMAGMGLPVETDTSFVDVQVGMDGGHIRTEYKLYMAGDEQHVSLEIQFRLQAND